MNTNIALNDPMGRFSLPGTSPALAMVQLATELQDGVLFYTQNALGYYSFISPSVTQIMGYQPDQVIGRRYDEMQTDNDQVNGGMDFRAALTASTPRPARFAEVKHVDGSPRMIKFWTVPWRDAVGQSLGLVGVAHLAEGSFGDSTQSRREDRRSQLDQLAEPLRHVLDLLIGGKMNKQIAVELGVSLRTVEARRQRLMKHFAVSSFADLVKAYLAASSN
jgi:PAS domain S-box-containing protein